MYTDYDDLDEAYEDTPRLMKMQRIQDEGPRLREKANKPARRDKWEGVIARNRVERGEDE